MGTPRALIKSECPGFKDGAPSATALSDTSSSTSVFVVLIDAAEDFKYSFSSGLSASTSIWDLVSMMGNRRGKNRFRY